MNGANCVPPLRSHSISAVVRAFVPVLYLWRRGDADIAMRNLEKINVAENKKDPGIEQLADFRVSCRAGETGSLNVATDEASFVVAQRIRLDGNQQLWESLQVSCHKEEDGSLAVQVLIWDQKSEDALQIALLRSRPDEIADHLEAFECNLEQKILK